VTAALYALGPVAFFWTAMRLGATRAGAFYSLLAPSCWLVRIVRTDSGGWFGPLRLVSMVRYGEGPHIASLQFLVLATGLLDLALERRRAHHFVLAGLAMAATVLCNWIGAVELGLAVAAYLLAGVHKERKAAWSRTAAVGVFAYAVALPCHAVDRSDHPRQCAAAGGIQIGGVAVLGLGGFPALAGMGPEALARSAAAALRGATDLCTCRAGARQFLGTRGPGTAGQPLSPGDGLGILDASVVPVLQPPLACRVGQAVSPA
jgi:hypothetical protein